MMKCQTRETYPRDFKTANEMLQGRNQMSRRLPGRETYLERRGDDIALRFHNTDVVTFRPNGQIVLNSGGWRTNTTKDRMSLVVPVNQKDFSWFVFGRPYQDGMVVTQDWLRRQAAKQGREIDAMYERRRERRQSRQTAPRLTR